MYVCIYIYTYWVYSYFATIMGMIDDNWGYIRRNIMRYTTNVIFGCLRMGYTSQNSQHGKLLLMNEFKDPVFVL